MTRSTQIDGAALLKATGRSWAEWRALLDAAGAASMSHKDIAAWLHREHGVPGWWAQGLTVRYEQEIGRRAPGQTCAGDFGVGVSTTRPGTMDEVLAEWRSRHDDAVEFDGVPIEGPPRVSSTDKWRYWRVGLADGGRVSVNIAPKPGGKSSLQIEHGKLADAEAVERWRAFWKGRLESLRHERPPPKRL